MLCSTYQQGGYYARCTRWHYWLDHLGCHHHCCTSPVGRRLAKPSEQPVQCWKTCCTGSGRAGHALCYVLANHRRSDYATWRRRHRCRDGHYYCHRSCASTLGHRLVPNTSSPARPTTAPDGSGAMERARRLQHVTSAHGVFLPYLSPKVDGARACGLLLGARHTSRP